MLARPRTGSSGPSPFGRLLAFTCLVALLGGLFLAAVHHHTAGDDESHCALCSLAHSVAVHSAKAPLPGAPSVTGIAHVELQLQSPVVDPHATPDTRAPPAA